MRLLLKIILFLTVTGFCVTLLKQFSSNSATVERFDLEMRGFNEQSVVFVGSSRTRNSVNPKLLNHKSESYNFHNLGISGTSMVSHYVLSKYIIEHSEVNTVVVEMALILPDLPGSLESIMTHLDEPVIPSLWKLSNSDRILDFRFLMASYNSWLFNRMSLYDEVKNLVSPSSPEKLNRMGFIVDQKKGQEVQNTFIGWDEINADLSGTKKVKQASTYQYMARDLIRVAEESETCVLFLLPSNYRKSVEKATLLWWYHEIPSEFRFPLDAELVNKMNRSDYQIDDIHMSFEGSRVYSEELLRIWREMDLDKQKYSVEPN